VAHACHPSYSGDRDEDDCGSKPARVKSSQDCISKKPYHETVPVEWLKGVGPEFKPQYQEKKKKKTVGKK
jgi:hypothetical protein